MSVSVHYEFDAATLKVVVHLLVVDHLAQKKNAFVGIFFDRLIAYLNGVFHTIAKSKVSRDVELHRTEVKQGRRKILLAQIF